MSNARKIFPRQRGVATLLITLVLMMSITMLTLAVANTRRAEQVVNANDIWNTRLALAAEAGIAKAVSALGSGNRAWIHEPALQQQTWAGISRPGSGDVEIRTRLYRPAYHSGPVRIETEAIRNDGSGQSVRMSQYAQPLSALTPAAEKAPPLVVNGCISPAGGTLDILPAPARDSEPSDIMIAAWGSEATGCTPPGWTDMHTGAYMPRRLRADLWPVIFSINRQRFERLAMADQTLNGPERLYLMAAPADLVSGQWTRSLGSPVHPVFLYIPSALGCPGFSPGVRIYGVVFVDSDCTGSAGPFELELFGMLAINGDLAANSVSLRLSHLEMVDPELKTLIFPALRTVLIPGTWRDF